MNWNPPPEKALAPRRPADWVSLSRFRLQAIIGVYAYERLHPQPLEIDLAMQLDTRAAATSLDLTKSIDYAKVARDLRLMIQGARFHLLETAAEAAAAFLLLPLPDRSRPNAVRVTLSKPSALDGLACPSVAIYRTREDFEFLAGDWPGETRVFSSADVRITLVDATAGFPAESSTGFAATGNILIPLGDGDDEGAEGSSAQKCLAITRYWDREFLTKVPITESRTAATGPVAPKV